MKEVVNVAVAVPDSNLGDGPQKIINAYKRLDDAYWVLVVLWLDDIFHLFAVFKVYWNCV